MFSLFWLTQVHQTVLPVREGKDGWIDLFCPGGVCCSDDGEFFSRMVRKCPSPGVILNQHMFAAYGKGEIAYSSFSCFSLQIWQVARIMKCCVNKKKFLMKLKKTMIGPFMLLSLRGDKTCIEVSWKIA